MNNNNCWYKLNLDIGNALRPDFGITELSTGVRRFTNARDIFTTDWLEYMDSQNIPVNGIMIFNRRAGEGMDTLAHVDVHAHQKPGSEYRSFAINWVIGGSDSEMIWYDMPEIIPPVGYSAINTPHLRWPVRELTEIDRSCIQSQPTMVRVSMPHAISIKNEPRICISVRTNGIPDNWDRAVDYLRDKQILVER